MEFIEAQDGARIGYLDQGPKGADCVLWLQGLNAPAAAWAVQLAHFGQSCRSIAVEARGVGKSGAPQGSYTTQELAADAVAVLDVANVPRAHLVGLSLGGAAAQELALAHPERVRTLALLGSFAAQAPRSRALMESWRVLYPAVLPQHRAAWEQQAYAWLFSDKFWRSESNMRAALRFAGTQPPQSAAGFLGQLDAALSHDTRARLPGLKVPTLVLHGALDQLAPLAAGEELARLIPGAQLVVLPEVGHAVNLEAQRQVHACLRALWKRG